MLLFDAISPLERIQINRELANISTRLTGSVSAIDRVRLTRETTALIAKLGEAADLIFDASRPEETAKSLSEYLDSGLKDLPEALRAAEAMTIAELADQIGAREVFAKSRAEAAKYQASFPAVFDEIHSRGLSVNIDKESLSAKIEEAQRISRGNHRQDENWQRLQLDMRKLNESVREKVSSFDEKVRIANMAYSAARKSGDKDVLSAAESTIELLLTQRKELREKYSSDFNALEKKSNEIAKQFKVTQAERANAVVAEEGNSVINAIKDVSPVSEKDAMAWALSQKVEDSAIKRLSRQGYKKEQLYQDIADFYRLSGGKASAISIVNTGSRRAYATNIDTVTAEKEIAVDGDFTRITLFHELAHHLENDPIAKAAANGYLLKRRESPKTYPLRSLTGNSGYSLREIAYKDSFLSPYMGKVYRDQATEVFSLAVQYLASPLDAATMYAKDPELFAMVSGYLGGAITPAMKAKLGLHSGKIEEKADLRKQEEQLKTKLATGIVLTPSSWFEELYRHTQSAATFSVRRVGGVAAKMKTIGGSGGLYIIEGPVADYGKRASKGYIVVRDTGGYPDASFAGRTLQDGKALLAAALHLGGDLLAAKNRFFNSTPDAIEQLKQLAGAKK